MGIEKAQKHSETVQSKLMMLVEDKLTVVVKKPVESLEPEQVELTPSPEVNLNGEMGDEGEMKEEIPVVEPPSPSQIELVPLKDYTLKQLEMIKENDLRRH